MAATFKYTFLMASTFKYTSVNCCNIQIYSCQWLTHLNVVVKLKKYSPFFCNSDTSYCMWMPAKIHKH